MIFQPPRSDQALKFFQYGADVGNFFGTGVARVSVRDDNSIEISRDMVSAFQISYTLDRWFV